MGLIPCSACQKRPSEKLSQVTWAWTLANGQRRAWRQRLCLGCFVERVMRYDRPVEPTGALSCPGCGIDTSDDLDPVYATAYVPDAGKIRFEMAFCASCAVAVRTSAQENGLLLEEVPLGASTQAPSTTDSSSAWSQLGIQPRE